MAVRSVYYEMPHQLVMVNELREPFKRLAVELQREHPRKLVLFREGLIIWRALDKLPEPSIENVRQPGSRILIRIRDYFFACHRLPYLGGFFRKIFNFIIIIYDTDFYRSFIDVWVRELRASPWPGMGPQQPDPHFWQEGQPPYGRTWEEEQAVLPSAPSETYSAADRLEARALLGV